MVDRVELRSDLMFFSLKLLPIKELVSYLICLKKLVFSVARTNEGKYDREENNGDDQVANENRCSDFIQPIFSSDDQIVGIER